MKERNNPMEESSFTGKEKELEDKKKSDDVEKHKKEVDVKEK